MIQQFQVKGMTCAACSNRVEKGLNDLTNVKATVNFATEKAHVEYDPKKISFAQIEQKIQSLGYDIILDEAQLDIIGMTCAACSGRIERVLNRDPRIESATVNLALETGTIRYNPEEISIEEITEKIRNIGFDAVPKETNAPREKDDETEKKKRQLLLSIMLTFPLLWTMFSHFSFTSFIYVPPILLNPYVQWAIATPVQFIIGANFYKGAYYSLKNKSANMDVLVALGTSAAYFYSVYLVFQDPSHGLYFETSAMLITLILLGKYFEAKAKGRSSDAIRSLIQMQPTTATLIRNGKHIEVPIQEVVLNDILLIRAGEAIPVDGVIVEGETTIDESMLTGESMPVHKSRGAETFTATINTGNPIRIRTNKIGKDTMLSQIIKIVEEAQGSKAPIQRLADQISNVFVPIVVGIALLTFVIWYIIVSPGDFATALKSTIAVLVIACPCALGLATPTSIMAGSGRAAEYGILFKTAEAMERAKDVDTIVFDKTGTITEGRPTVTHFETTRDQAKLLSAIVSIERESEHPLATAIVRYGEEQNIPFVPIEQFQTIMGKGVSATVNQETIHIGNKTLMDEYHIALPNDLSTVDKYRTQGETVMYIAADGKYCGFLTVADPIKEGAVEAIQQLHEAGYSTMMLTGDNEKTAEAIAKKVGIKEVIADVLPTNKAETIDLLESSGLRVAMIGDGINDAPALARASIGIAMGTGTDIAIEAADITLMQGNISLVPKTFRMSAASVRNIKQNLFWALAYNSLGIPIAAMGLLAPWVAGAAMAFSSVSVVLNALRLQKIKL